MPTLRYLVLALLMTMQAAWAQSFPDKSRPIKIIAPSGAASLADLLARAFSRGMADVAGLNVIVENKPGAEGVIGLQAVKTAAPDGYTLLLTSSSTQVLNVLMLPQLPYDPVADFVPLTGIARVSLLMNVGPSAPFKSAREFIAAAKANPGKYTYGSGTASTRLAGEMLEAMAGIKLLSVPYKTVAEALTAAAGGQVDMAIADPASSTAQLKAGRLHTLAVTGPTRLKIAPQVPTMREEGVPDYQLSSWMATYMPANAAPAVVASLREILGKSAKTAYVTDILSNGAMEPLEIAGDELTTLQRADIAVLSKVVRPPKP